VLVGVRVGVVVEVGVRVFVTVGCGVFVGDGTDVGICWALSLLPNRKKAKTVAMTDVILIMMNSLRDTFFFASIFSL